MIEGKAYFFRRLLIVFLVIVAIVLAIFAIGSQLILKQEIKVLEINQQRDVKLEVNMLETYLDETVLDLKTMSENQSFKNFFTGKLKNRQEVDGFNELFCDLLKQKERYNQLRHLDNKGMEVFRIDRLTEGKALICPGDHLQNKSSRYYFKEAINLGPGFMYVSPLDLNIEYGKVEIPYRPMIRLCVPVFDNGERWGINVLNYDASGMLNNLKRETTSKDGQFYLVNKTGYFLSAPDTSIEWGFMFPAKKDWTIKKLFPGDYQRIDTTMTGQFRTDRGLFTVHVVKPFKYLVSHAYNNLSPRNYSWKAISFVPAERMTFASFIPIGRLSLLLGLVMVIAFIFSSLYARIAMQKYVVQQVLIESEKQLKIANKTKDRFFSIISHDLKNSSSSIADYLEFMSENLSAIDAEEMTMHLSDVSFAASQHNKLLYEILEWARLQQGTVDFNPTSFKIKELFEGKVSLVDLQLKKKGLVIDIDVEPDLQVYADRDMMRTIFRNLINNAIKFSFRENRIILSGKSKGEKVELKVIDFGVGMKSEDADKIFDLTTKFQRAGTENEAGTGFGLKLVAELVKKNKGEIRVESKLGEGTSFIMNFPSGK